MVTKLKKNVNAYDFNTHTSNPIIYQAFTNLASYVIINMHIFCLIAV